MGFVVGATGVGGGSLMTPLLTLVFNVPAQIAVGTDLLFAAITKSGGVLAHTRRGNVHWAITGWLVADRKSTRLNSSHTDISRMPSSA